MFLKNSSGQKSASFTMMIISYLVVTLWLLVSIVSKIGNFEIRPFSGAEAMAYLTPILMLYWGRRWQEGQVGAEAPTPEVVATPVSTSPTAVPLPILPATPNSD